MRDRGPCVRPSAPSCRPNPSSAGADRRRRRQVDHEPGPALGAVGDLDAAAVPIDDPGRDGQAEPGPAARRAVRPVEALEQVRQVLRAGSRDRRPRPSATLRRRRRGPATPTRPSVGLWRMALSTRIITSWRRRAGSPDTTAGCGSTSTRTPRSVAGLPSAWCAVGRDVAEVDRHVFELHRARIRPRQEQQVLDDRGHVPDLLVDVLERGADRLDRLACGGARGSRRCCGSRSAACAARGWRRRRTRAGGAAPSAGWRATRGSARARAGRRRRRSRRRPARRPGPRRAGRPA